MTFWQENYHFIKDVYDKRAEKIVELMDQTEQSMAEVKADKIYTSSQFKKVKEHFVSMARNLEQPEASEWLSSTKEMLYSDKTGKEQDQEAVKLNDVLTRYGNMQPLIEDTKKVVDCLWKAYEFTDEISPIMEWLEENRNKSTREISSSCASQTEDLIEKQEKTLDQLDKKRKIVMDMLKKGEKIADDPKSPAFLKGHIGKLRGVWDECNREGDKRLEALKENLASWEKYEGQRNDLCDKLNGAEATHMSMLKIFKLEAGPKEQETRIKTAAKIRKDLESVFKGVSDNNDILQRMLDDDKKAELTDEVEGLRERLKIVDSMDEKLKGLDEFNKQLVEYNLKVKELEAWLAVGRKRMDELLNPPAPIQAEERVMATMEFQAEVTKQIDEHKLQAEKWEMLQPTEAGEDTPEAQSFVSRMSTVEATLSALNEEVGVEGAKFGDDVKFLADFTGAMKRFEPWIVKSEAKKSGGCGKPKNLGEAEDILAEVQKWQVECDEMSKLLEDGNAAAQKMTLHAEADEKYAAHKKRWTAIDATSKEWMKKLDAMVVVWKKQAETAEKVQAAIAAKPDAEAPVMKLEDLERHLDALKQMFIEKQKMMEELEAGEKQEAAAVTT